MLASCIESESEECAFLNIWRPDVTEKRGSIIKRSLSPAVSRKCVSVSTPSEEEKLFEHFQSWDCALDQTGNRESLALFESGLPVMVFLYGGGFNNGGSCEPIYRGDILSANQSIIVVTLDYRLGVLGFLHIPVGEL